MSEINIISMEPLGKKCLLLNVLKYQWEKAKLICIRVRVRTHTSLSQVTIDCNIQ